MMGHIKNKKDTFQLYSTLPWHGKLKVNVSNWFDKNILHFHFPWKKFIGLLVILFVGGGLYLFVTLSQTDFPVRESYDKNNFMSSNDLIEDLGSTTTLENNYFEFVLDNNKTTFSIHDKQTDQYWHSNPDTTSKRFLNPLKLYYVGSLGKVTQISVIDQAVDYGDYSVKITDNALEVLYMVGGKKEVDSNDFPTIISAERMESILLSKLEEGSTEYRRITQQAFVSGEVNGVLVWKLKNGIQRSILTELYRIFYDVCGYTEEDLLYDQEANGILVEDKYPYFEIAIRYELSENGLVVTLVNDSIVEKEKYPLAYIDVLPYFGAGLETDEGYIFVPDGSGGLIDFNNERSFALQYNKRIYGKDYAQFRETMTEETPQIRLPVIGVKKNDYGFISIISQGAEMTNILANNSTDDNPYNQAYYRYNIREGDVYQFTSINSSVSIIKWTDDFNTQDLVLNYIFIENNDVTYNDMADSYREYLIEEEILEDKDSTDTPTIDLTLLGGYTSDENFIGIPYETVRSLTNTDEALLLLQALVNDGVTDINMFYKGLFNEGLKSQYLGDISYDKRTGSKKDIQELSDTLTAMGIHFYPEVFVNTAYTDKGINESSMVIRSVFGKTVYNYAYNPASLYQDTSTRKWYTLLPSTYDTALSSYHKSFDSIGITSIAFTDFGNQLYGSYKKGEVVFSYDTSKIFIDSMNELGLENTMFRTPNLYAIPYASVITDISYSSSNYQIITDSVPFYQLVFSGYLDYSSTPFNTSDQHSYQYNVMKAIETGSNISIEWSYNSTIDLVDSEYSIYYSTYYLNWYEKVLETYAELSDLGIYQSNLILHEILSDDGLVTKSVYANDTEIVFNYRDTAYNYSGTMITANQYLVTKEET